MAKYIVLDSKFNPMSFEDRIAPYKDYYTNAQTQLLAVADLETKAATLKQIADTHPEWLLEYNNYMDMLTNVRDTMYNYGVDGNLVKDVLKANKAFTEMSSMATADGLKRALTKSLNDVVQLDASAIHSLEGREPTAYDLRNNPYADLYLVVSGKLLLSEVATAVKGYKEQEDVPNADSDLYPGYRLTLTISGYTPKDMNYQIDWIETVINNPNYYNLDGTIKESVLSYLETQGMNPYLLKYVTDTLTASGVKGWLNEEATRKALHYIKLGLWEGVGKTQYSLTSAGDDSSDSDGNDDNYPDYNRNGVQVARVGDYLADDKYKDDLLLIHSLYDMTDSDNKYHYTNSEGKDATIDMTDYIRQVDRFRGSLIDGVKKEDNKSDFVLSKFDTVLNEKVSISNHRAIQNEKSTLDIAVSDVMGRFINTDSLSKKEQDELRKLISGCLQYTENSASGHTSYMLNGARLYEIIADKFPKLLSEKELKIVNDYNKYKASTQQLIKDNYGEVVKGYGKSDDFSNISDDIMSGMIDRGIHGELESNIDYRGYDYTLFPIADRTQQVDIIKNMESAAKGYLNNHDDVEFHIVELGYKSKDKNKDKYNKEEILEIIDNSLNGKKGVKIEKIYMNPEMFHYSQYHNMIDKGFGDFVLVDLTDGTSVLIPPIVFGLNFASMYNTAKNNYNNSFNALQAHLKDNPADAPEGYSGRRGFYTSPIMTEMLYNSAQSMGNMFKIYTGQSNATGKH